MVNFNFDPNKKSTQKYVQTEVVNLHQFYSKSLL